MITLTDEDFLKIIRSGNPYSSVYLPKYVGDILLSLPVVGTEFFLERAEILEHHSPEEVGYFLYSTESHWKYHLSRLESAKPKVVVSEEKNYDLSEEVRQAVRDGNIDLALQLKRKMKENG